MPDGASSRSSTRICGGGPTEDARARKAWWWYALSHRKQSRQDPAKRRTDGRTVDVTRPPRRRTADVAEEIAPDVFCLGPSGRTQTNVYLVRSGSSWTLIDAGWPTDASRIEEAAESLFGAGSRPAGILLTHDHPDHEGSALRLARTWGCAVYLHPKELPVATRDFAAMAASAMPLDRWVVLPLMRAMGEEAARGAVCPVEPRRGRAGVPAGRGGTRTARLGLHPHAGPHTWPRVVLPTPGPRPDHW